MKLTPEELERHHEDMLKQLEQARDRAERTKEIWGPGGTGYGPRMTVLALKFPTLQKADGINPWSPEHLVRWLLESGAPTGGSRHAAKFLLQVWNSREDWGLYAEELGIANAILEPFNVVDAMGVWDQAHQDAFRLWCTYPFWP